ncbi:hypothetical protein JCM9534A_73330 [Catenuloplanes indicus JCM 9534]
MCQPPVSPSGRIRQTPAVPSASVANSTTTWSGMSAANRSRSIGVSVGIPASESPAAATNRARDSPRVVVSSRTFDLVAAACAAGRSAAGSSRVIVQPVQWL